MSQTVISNPNTTRLRTLYRSELRSRLRRELSLKNMHEVPELEKIVVNVGVGRAKDDKRALELVKNTLRKITGQEPVEIMSKKSIAGFKIRRGQNRIGVKVTLRGSRMYEFLDRLVNVVLPRVRDFHGVSDTAFDPDGNYALGIKEHSVFPELEFDDIATLHSLQVIFVIQAKDRSHGKALLEALGMPFQKEVAKGARNV